MPNNHSACMCIGPRFNVNCSNITTVNEHELTWCNESRYVGVFVTASREFTCSYDDTKRSFYRAFNALFGKVGRFASEEVIVELQKMKCLPCYFMVCNPIHLVKSQIKSLNLAIKSAFSKIFGTVS